jgi:hypothetical protein
MLQNKETGKLPRTKKEKAAVVNALIQEHPSLSTDEIAEITSIHRRSITDYLTDVVRNKEKSKVFNDLESIALDNICLKIAASIEHGDIIKVPVATRIEAYCKLFDRRQVLAQRHAMRDSLSGVIEAIRNRQQAKGSRTTVTVSVTQDSPPSSVQGSGGVGEGGGSLHPPIIHDNILSPQLLSNNIDIHEEAVNE